MVLGGWGGGIGEEGEKAREFREGLVEAEVEFELGRNTEVLCLR